MKDAVSADSAWWNSDPCPNDNHPLSVETWEELKTLVAKLLPGKSLYVVDVFYGASPATRMKVRFVMEVAWQAHFVKNMFIRPTEQELDDWREPDFVLLAGSKAVNKNWQKHAMHSENFIAFNLDFVSQGNSRTVVR